MKLFFSKIKILLFFIGLTLTAQAQATYPERPIKIIVPFSAGGAADNAARLLGEQLTKKFNQTVIIENKPGVSGIIGTQTAARAEPDGYTLIIGTLTTHALNPFFVKNVGYDPVEDFVPITMFSTYSNALIVPIDSPYNSIQDIIQKLKKEPKSLTYGTSGAGTSQHLAGLMFQKMTNTELTPVPYKGGGAALADLMGGHINMVFETISASKGVIDGKRVKVLGITSSTPIETLPGIKPISDQGLPGFEVKSWFGIFAPRGTPASITKLINAEIINAVKLPVVKEKLQSLGSEPAFLSLADFEAHQKSEVEKWKKIVLENGIKAE